MSLTEKKMKTVLEKDNSQANKRKSRRTTLNLFILMTFVFQLILPIGLHVNAVSEAEAPVEATTVHAQEAEDQEKAEEYQQIEEAERQALAEKEAEEEATRKAEEEARKDAEEKAIDESKEIEDKSSPSKDEETNDGKNEEIKDEEKEEDVEEEEDELAEDFPAIATPVIPIPMMKMARSSGGLQDTIEVEKTAKRTPGCRTFEVNLNITGIPQEAPVDVVLVIDRSGSMNERAGGTNQNPLSRLYYAKQAAINFAGRVLGPNGIPGSRVSVVSFSGPTTTSGNGAQNQASTDLNLSANLTTVTNTVNAISAVGGTNTEAGFKQGQSVIEGTISNQNPNSSKVVIMLTDGLPTASNGNKYEESTDINHIHIQRAIAAGKNIFQNNIADVFTIGLTTGMNSTEKTLADNILTQAQNKGYYPAPSATDLDSIFNTISQSLGYAATSAKVVDKIGDHFDLIESSLPAGATYDANTREIKWNPGTIIDGASLTYKIVAKASFPGGLADTNKFAKLTYTDIFGTPNKTKDFPVPKVNVPTLIEVSLTDATIDLGDSINLGSGTVSTGENYMSPVTGGDNDGENFTYEWRIKGETDSFSSDKNPTVSPTEDTEYEVTVTDSNGCIAVATMLVTVNKKVGKISISKIIKDLDQIMDLPFFGSVDPSIFENIEFEIKVSGPGGYEQTVEVKHGETETLNQLAFGEYSVEEINIDDRFLLENINPTSFELTKDNQWVEVEVVNKVNYANFEFMKVDEEGNSLAGIDFELSKDGVTETVTTVANEKVSFNFLEPGDYVLKETKTIAGFRLPTETWIIQVVRNVTTGQLEVIVPDDSFITGNLEDGYEIKNEEQGEFPKTGGVGGLSYIVAGLTILTSSLGIYVRKEEE